MMNTLLGELWEFAATQKAVILGLRPRRTIFLRNFEDVLFSSSWQHWDISTQPSWQEGLTGKAARSKHRCPQVYDHSGAADFHS